MSDNPSHAPEAQPGEIASVPHLGRSSLLRWPARTSRA